MSKKQREALAKGRKKLAARRKNKGKGRFCVITRTAKGKSTQRCYSTEGKAWESLVGKKGNKYKSIMLYSRKNA